MSSVENLNTAGLTARGLREWRHIHKVRLADVSAISGVSVPFLSRLEALAQLAGEVVALKDFLSRMVASLEALSYDGGAKVGEQAKVEMLLYERALDRAERVLATIARLNVDERLVRLEGRPTLP